MYFLSCFVKAGLFSHSDLSTKITWEGQEWNWNTGFSKTQDRLKYIPFSCPYPLCVPNPLFHGVHKSRKTHYWSHTRTHVCSAVISSDVSHNLNMNFSFISSPLRGKVAFHVAISFSNARWHCGICMARWSGLFCNGFLFLSPPLSIFFFYSVGYLVCSELKNCII